MNFGKLILNHRIWLAALLLAVGFWASGCSSTGEEPENVSSKPWNSPEGYQNGNLPSNMFH